MGQQGLFASAGNSGKARGVENWRVFAPQMQMRAFSASGKQSFASGGKKAPFIQFFRRQSFMQPFSPKVGNEITRRQIKAPESGKVGGLK